MMNDERGTVADQADPCVMLGKPVVRGVYITGELMLENSPPEKPLNRFPTIIRI